MKRPLSIAATAAMMLVGVASVAVPAHAGPGSTLKGSSVSIMAGPCGSSYTHIGHHAIRNNSGTTLAYMDVYWSWSSQRNCLVTNHAGATYGERAYTQATIRPSGRSWPRCPSSTGCDGDMYSYYAGPVYTPRGVDMSNRCIDIKGVIGWHERTVTKRHCG